MPRRAGGGEDYSTRAPTSNRALFPVVSPVTTNSLIMTRWWWKRGWREEPRQPPPAFPSTSSDLESNPECERVLDGTSMLSLNRDNPLKSGWGSVSETGCIESRRWKGGVPRSY